MKYFLYLFLSLTASVSSAEWLGDYEITNLVLEGTDEQPIVNVSLSPNPQTACPDNTFVTMQTSSEMGKQALSVMMIAAASNKKIKVFVDGCVGIRPNVRHVWLIN